MVVRVGKYAVVDGNVCRASFSRSGDVMLVYRGSSPPPGYVWDDRGYWYLDLEREECSRLFTVATSAYWNHLFPVRVEEVREHQAVAAVRYFPGQHPAPAPKGDDGKVLVPPWPEDHLNHGWTRPVPFDELCCVTELEYDYPLEPSTKPINAIEPALPPHDDECDHRER